MPEVVILPEMVIAGVEAMHECRDAGLSDEDTVKLVYVSMAAIFEMAVQREQITTRH